MLTFTGKRIVLFVFGVVMTFVPGNVSAQDAAEGLKDLSTKLFPVGVGVGVDVTDQSEHWPFLKQHFDYVTPENCIKVQGVHPSPDEYQFEAADRFVQFADEQGFKLVGHCLVWAKDDRTPPWFYAAGDREVTSQELLDRMRQHITTVVRRYRGKVAMWDVVNEALSDGDREDYLRESGWSRITGEEFLVKAFQYAHASDPDAMLIYNDYRCDTPGKRDKLIKLATMLKKRGALVHAIGLQGHYELDEVPLAGLEEMFKAMRDLGYKIVVSELDIDVVKRGRWWADGGKYREELAQYDPYRDSCPPEILARQAEQYAELFELFVKYRDVVERVSFWNLHDGTSWLNYFPWQRVNHPLLFDRDMQPKPAYESVANVLRAAKQ